jgi:hypothetical protein
MKALGVLESKWDPIRKKLVRHVFEEQDKVLLSYFTQKGEMRIKGGEQEQFQGPGTCPMGHLFVKTTPADRGQVTKSRSTVRIMKIGFFVYYSFLVLLSSRCLSLMMMIFYLFLRLQKQQIAYCYIPVWVHLREIEEKNTCDDVA